LVSDYQELRKRIKHPGSLISLALYTGLLHFFLNFEVRKMGAHTFNTQHLGGQRQAFCEFEVSMVYIASSRPARAAKRDSVRDGRLGRWLSG